MITLFTRALLVVSLGVSFCICTGTASAQKKSANKPATAKAAAQPKKEVKQSDPAQLGTIEAQDAENKARMNKSDAYILYTYGSPLERKALEGMTGSFPIKVKEFDSQSLRLVTGEPDILVRVKAAYPEFTWITLEQFLDISNQLQVNPELGNADRMEKIKSM